MSQGRGRGRGRGAFQAEPKRPGGTAEGEISSPKGGAVTMDGLVSSLNSLSFETKDLSQTSQAFVNASNMDKSEMAQLVYQRCCKDWRMARTISLLCKQIIEEPKEGHQFRTAIMSTLQNDFKKKNELRNSDKAHYLGCMAFLCQVYANLRDERGELFSVLLKPVFEAIESMLDNKAEEEEVLCSTTQLFTCGKTMQLSDPTRWRQVIQAVRDVILDNRGSRELRATCVDLVEVAASEWKMSTPQKYQ